MINKLLSFACFALILCVATFLSAEPIEFVHEGRASGEIDGAPFPESFIVVTASADTSNREFLDPDVYFIDHETARISIEGIGEFDMLSDTRTFVNQTASIVGFSRGTADGADLLNGPTDVSFADWEMLTPIARTTGVGEVLQWGEFDPEVLTTAGRLILNSNVDEVIFTARIVPEPLGFGSFCFFGLFGMLRARRTRSR